MSRWRAAVASLIALALAACGAPEAPPTPTPPAATATPVPQRAEDVASAFFKAWQEGRYADMYPMLSTDAQAATPRDVFLRRYTNIHDGIGEMKLTVHATGALTPRSDPSHPAADAAELPFETTRTLAIFGEISESNALPLTRDASGAWKVAWQPGLIFSGLTPTSTVRVVPEIPKRGRILDRGGKALADNGTILAVGVVPGEVQDEPALLSAMSDALGVPPETIKQRYQGGQPTWFMPIVERSDSERGDLQTKIGSIPGVSLQDRPGRVYPLGARAAHVVGYVAHPTADELRELASAGYDESDWIGRAGIEAAYEKVLAGTRGGAIQIVDPGGKIAREIVRKPSAAGRDIQLTLDAPIQNEAANALGDKTGSAVVLDPRDNSLLALASQPSFDPNDFITGISDDEWQQLNGPQRPLVLRATESAYPTGSIFKVITMAAGLENGVTNAAEKFDCGIDWNGLPGVTLHNWQPEGILSLPEALTESCNPAFYEIGLRLDRMDPTILPTFARRFGLGHGTSIPAVSEVAGTVPDPTWKQQQVGQTWTSGDSVNLAIGQGFLLATPLQMANAYSALARGGSLVAPRLVDGQDQPTLGSLDLAPATTAAILDGMKRVTSTPQGTAYYAFRDEKLAIAAKTGSAENENPDAHAWFVGFTPPDKASLLVLVMIEGGQHGGTVAAPVARELIDTAYPLSR